MLTPILEKLIINGIAEEKIRNHGFGYGFLQKVPLGTTIIVHRVTVSPFLYFRKNADPRVSDPETAVQFFINQIVARSKVIDLRIFSQGKSNDFFFSQKIKVEKVANWNVTTAATDSPPYWRDYKIDFLGDVVLDMYLKYENDVEFSLQALSSTFKFDNTATPFVFTDVNAAKTSIPVGKRGVLEFSRIIQNADVNSAFSPFPITPLRSYYPYGAPLNDPTGQNSLTFDNQLENSVAFQPGDNHFDYDPIYPLFNIWGTPAERSYFYPFVSVQYVECNTRKLRAYLEKM